MHSHSSVGHNYNSTRLVVLAIMSGRLVPRRPLAVLDSNRLPNDTLGAKNNKYRDLFSSSDSDGGGEGALEAGILQFICVQAISLCLTARISHVQSSSSNIWLTHR